MIKKLTKFSIGLLLPAIMLCAVIVPAQASAAISNCTSIADCVSDGSCETSKTPAKAATATTPAVAATCATATSADNSINDIIKTVVNILSFIVGVIAVIMIIIGGLKYITSGGDTGKVTSAKSTILYAIVGLIIVALAQIIVKFVLEKVK